MQTRKDRMEMLALLAEIIGAIAVVVSVIYLAVQIAESNKELKSQTHFNALTLGQRPLEIELENGELASIVNRGYADPAQLTDDEWYRFTQYQIIAVNAWEYYYYEKSKGTLPVELWVGANAYYENHFRTKPGLLKFWQENRHIYGEPFRSYVERAIESTAD